MIALLPLLVVTTVVRAISPNKRRNIPNILLQTVLVFNVLKRRRRRRERTPRGKSNAPAAGRSETAHRAYFSRRLKHDDDDDDIICRFPNKKVVILRVVQQHFSLGFFQRAKNTRKGKKRLFVSVSQKRERLTTTTLFPALVYVTRAREREERGKFYT
jgi:hypothetical protein